jgi:ABC-type multidrug transport system fused ATPase/permease subunit
MSKLNHIRNDQELKTLRKVGAAQAFFNFAWSSTPFLVSCSTFMVFVLTQEDPLTTDIVFTALTLFNLLAFPLAILPMVITSIVEASVAVGRLTSFFTADELQADAVIRREAAAKIGEESVRIRDGTFTWNKHGENTALQNINFSAAKGDLSCIVGRVGAGKSSFLQAILGDLWKICGGVEVRGDIAYVAQQAWVMNASVKENIVFGHRWDPSFYDQTVRACALLEDFESLPDGDRTEVGERGISLSGGQKARLTLARAVYARADIYLLDDVLSAVDQHVGRHLIDNVLGPKGLLSCKTKILATNSIPVLMEADHITLLKDGRIVEAGNYDQAMANKEGIASLIRTAKKQDEEGSSQGSSSSDEYTTVVEIITPSSEDDDELKNAGLVQSIKSRGSMDRQCSSTNLRRASAASFKGPRGITHDEEGAGPRTAQNKEHSEQGKVKWNVYAEYAKWVPLYPGSVCKRLTPEKD